MTFIRTFVLLAAATMASSPLATARTPANHNWPQWRGPDVTGIVHDADPPVEWSESKNIKWKVPLPGHGLSTPIVWADTVFIQYAESTDKGDKSENDGDDDDGERGRGRGPWGDNPTSPHRFVLMALNGDNGETLWKKTLTEQVPHEGSHRDGSLAPASPVTDGERVYAYFGSRGLYCLNMKGDIVWQKDFGQMQTRRGFGEGSSPAVG